MNVLINQFYVYLFMFIRIECGLDIFNLTREWIACESYGNKAYLSTLFKVSNRQGLLLVSNVTTNVMNRLFKLVQDYKPGKNGHLSNQSTTFSIRFSTWSIPDMAIPSLPWLIFIRLIAYCFYPSGPAVCMPQRDNY